MPSESEHDTWQGADTLAPDLGTDATRRGDALAGDDTLAAGDVSGLDTLAAVADDGTEPTLADARPRPSRARGLLEPGASLGRYVVLSRLGAGGMGVVYAAYDPELDRKVAIKLIRPELGEREGAESAEATGARVRLLREAQALARLAHPNVVAVHDVGEHGGAVWLAMEFVAGQTLAAWLEAGPRTWREVLAVMLAAAHGLAAAHAKGLVHRDFKPDNLMIGDDGRVRVMDLGLARAHVDERDEDHHQAATSPEPIQGALAVQVTRAGAIMGTPAYMAPEQFAGADVDARADVFAFCVTLWEALHGQRPFAGSTFAELAGNVTQGRLREAPRGSRVPAWLRRVCLRGLAVAPERRLASMDAVITALRQAQVRVRVRAAALSVGVLTIVAGGFEAARRHQHASAVAACEAEGARIDAVWSPSVSATLRDGLLATEVPYAAQTVERVTPFIAAQAEAWRRAAVDACLDAKVEGRWTGEQLDRAQWCLDERRLELSALVDALTRADRLSIQEAVTAAASLAPISTCRDATQLALLPGPPDQRDEVREVRAALARASAATRTGQLELAATLGEEAQLAAASLDWAPLIAEAELVVGVGEAAAGNYTAAQASLEDAYYTAAEAGAWGTSEVAAAELVRAVGVAQVRPAEGKAWSRHREVALAQLGEGEGSQSLRRAGFETSLGELLEVDGDPRQARVHLERGLALREAQLGPDHPDVAASLRSLAHVLDALGERSEALALHRRALAISERAFGPDHPEVAAALVGLANAAADLGDRDEARAGYARALQILEQGLGPEHPDLVAPLHNLAIEAFEDGDTELAIARSERVVRILEAALGRDHARLAPPLNVLATIHYVAGHPDRARGLFARSLAIHEANLGPDHPDLAVPSVGFGDFLRSIGEHDEAAQQYARAIAIYERAYGPDHPDLVDPLLGLALSAVAREQFAEALVNATRAAALCETQEVRAGLCPPTHFTLAKAKWDAPGEARDRSGALTEARRALADYREADNERAATEVVEWLAARGG